ncbi:hypothetical protein [Treponema denticola]|uniref:hypothetical protein n=1 Tax=Treponema denticola TaxID=158 RepID=UPI0020A5D284|nr:hypothetical protein [Treponema denticola]
MKPNRQNVFCGAERIVIEFYAGNAAGRMSTGFRSSLSVCSKLKCRILIKKHPIVPDRVFFY